MDIEQFKKDCDAWINSDKGKTYFEDLERKENRRERWINKISRIKYNDFIILVDKIIQKYSSNEYRNRFNECEPHETLFYYLYDCASNYDREATEVEFSKYGNMFTCGLFFYRGYFFNRMNGQGTVIHITKET